MSRDRPFVFKCPALLGVCDDAAERGGKLDARTQSVTHESLSAETRAGEAPLGQLLSVVLSRCEVGLAGARHPHRVENCGQGGRCIGGEPRPGAAVVT